MLHRSTFYNKYRYVFWILTGTSCISARISVAAISHDTKFLRIFARFQLAEIRHATIPMRYTKVYVTASIKIIVLIMRHLVNKTSIIHNKSLKWAMRHLLPCSPQPRKTGCSVAFTVLRLELSVFYVPSTTHVSSSYWPHLLCVTNSASLLRSSH